MSSYLAWVYPESDAGTGAGANALIALKMNYHLQLETDMRVKHMSEKPHAFIFRYLSQAANVWHSIT